MRVSKFECPTCDLAKTFVEDQIGAEAFQATHAGTTGHMESTVISKDVDGPVMTETGLVYPLTTKWYVDHVGRDRKPTPVEVIVVGYDDERYDEDDREVPKKLYIRFADGRVSEVESEDLHGTKSAAVAAEIRSCEYWAKRSDTEAAKYRSRADALKAMNGTPATTTESPPAPPKAGDTISTRDGRPPR